MKSFFSSLALLALLSVATPVHAGGEVVGGMVAASRISLPLRILIDLRTSPTEQFRVRAEVDRVLHAYMTAGVVSLATKFETEDQIELCIAALAYDLELLAKDLIMVSPRLVYRSDETSCFILK